MSLKNSPYYLKPLGKKPKYTETEKQIIAWSLEWEGSISLTDGQRADYAQIGLSINNTNLKRLQRFKEIVQLGKISKGYAKGENHKPIFLWSVHSLLECWYILKYVYPYLIGKQQQAKNFIAFAESRLKRGATLNRVLFSRYEYSLIEKTKKLNKRGIS